MTFEKYRSIENHYNDKFINIVKFNALDHGDWYVHEKIHGCFKHDTAVMLANGEEKAISLIEKGDKVLSFNVNSGEFEPATVEAVVVRPQTKGWLRLKFDGTEVVCTKNHLFLTTAGYIEAQHLTSEHEIVSINSLT